MIWLTLAIILLVFCFGIVLLVGAPYLPTLTPQVAAALELANVKQGQTLLELGCGDGRVVVAAAQKGYKVVGYELNPILAAIAWIRTTRYRNNVQIIWGDYWQKPWPEAQAIFVFLLPKYMDKLNKKIESYSHRPINLVSFAFEIPKLKPTRQKSGVFLYKYR